MVKRILAASSTLLMAPWAVAFAQPAPPTSVPTTGVPDTLPEFYKLVCVASNWFFAFVIVIAVFFLLYGAFKFFTAAGSEDAVGGARKAIVWGLVGVAVAILARSLVLVVGNFLGAPSGSYFGC